MPRPRCSYGWGRSSTDHTETKWEGYVKADPWHQGRKQGQGQWDSGETQVPEGREDMRKEKGKVRLKRRIKARGEGTATAVSAGAAGLALVLVR